jgi:cytochrome P450
VNALLRDRRFGREPPDHTRPRDLVLRAFTRRRIAALAPGIAALATGLADRLEAPEADLLPAFARPLPVIVIARLLGVPEERAPAGLVQRLGCRAPPPARPAR